MADKRATVMVMAGGKGTRLTPLTCHRSKPAVPIGSRYRIIDFVLSNFVNSGYRKIFVLTQYMASSLIQHLNRTWRMADFGEFIEVVPAQMRTGDSWYVGTADSVYQNRNLLRDHASDDVAIFGGDHVYKMAVDQMEDAHRAKRADCTVAALPVPRDQAHEFGVIATDAVGRVTGFLEKPKDPPGMPGRPDMSLVSMGNYFFRRQVLEDSLAEDHGERGSSHDFGKNVIPKLVAEGARVFTYDFATNKVPGEDEGEAPYWRDVGTVDAYFQANMDLRARLPKLNLYNRSWPVRTAQRDYPPARFVRAAGDGPPSEVIDSMVCEGSMVGSAYLFEVLLGYDCFVHSGSSIEESVVLSGCDIGAGARLRRVLLDKNCKIDRGATIGLDPEADAARFPFITESGIVVLPKGTHVPAQGPIQFAYDIEEMIEQDELLKEKLAAFTGTIEVSTADRHSYTSAGPRYWQFAAGEGAATEEP